MASTQPKKPLLVLVGATGTGKSQLAVDLAVRFNGEIINGDAMQLYDGLPIITNKITPEERRGVPHHLLGHITLREKPWTAREFVINAIACIEEIHSRGKLPLVVGGTHYYLQSLLFENSLIEHGQANEFPRNSEGGEKSEWPILEASNEDMLAELRLVDPVMAGRWHPNDRRKIRRSLEIFLTTGRKASDTYAHQLKTSLGADEPEASEPSAGKPTMKMRFPALILWTYTRRDLLNSRLDKRVHSMIRAGLLEESQSLHSMRKNFLDSGHVFDESKGIWVSIGCKELWPYCSALKEGKSPDLLNPILKYAVERIKIATRQYSKSQVRWIRIKLCNALRHAEDGQIFMLDTCEPTEWDRDVLKPAGDLTKTFLAGNVLPDTREHSELARDILKKSHNEEIECLITRSCKECGVTAATLQQWNQHISSRRHRNTMQAKAKTNKPIQV